MFGALSLRRAAAHSYQMSMKPAALAFCALVLGLSACQDPDKGYDAIHGPENVLGAPLFSADNRQQDKTNRELMEKAQADSMFYSRRAQEQTTTDSASAPADTSVAGKNTAAEAGVNPSAGAQTSQEKAGTPLPATK